MDTTLQHLYAEPATNSFLRELRGSNDLPHVYTFHQHTPGTPDIPELLPVGMLFRSDFGPGHCHHYEGMVCGHSQHVSIQPEGRFPNWTVRTACLWRLQQGEHPDPGWWNELVAVGGEPRPLFTANTEKITLLGMAPPEWYRPYLDAIEQARRRRITEEARAAQLALF